MQVVPLDGDFAVRRAARDLFDRRRGGLEQRTGRESVRVVHRVAGGTVGVDGVGVRRLDAVHVGDGAEVGDELVETGPLGGHLEGGVQVAGDGDSVGTPAGGAGVSPRDPVGDGGDGQPSKPRADPAPVVGIERTQRFGGARIGECQPRRARELVARVFDLPLGQGGDGGGHSVVGVGFHGWREGRRDTSAAVPARASVHPLGRRVIYPYTQQEETMTTRHREDAGGREGPSTPHREHDDVAPAVAVDGLYKRFGSGPDAVTAVDGVSFAVERGSVVGLLGPNGAGKTTLIKSIIGTVLPDAGTVRIMGVDVREAPREAYGHVDAMLEGARNDYWRLTVRENLRYFATVGGVDPDSVATRHDRLLDRLDLAAKADEPVRNLSRGMKQKVSLASVLAGGADVVFLDEPTLGLDVASARTFRAEIRRLAAETGLTVVLSSHDMEVVEAVCDRVIVVADGRIVADDTVEALLRDDEHTLWLTSPAFDADVVASLRERFAVTDVERLDDGARIEVTADTDGLYALMGALRRRDVPLTEVRSVDPGLDDVLLDLTGDPGRGAGG